MKERQDSTIDWTPAIARNRAALLRVVAVLFFYAGLDEGGADTVPRRVWRRILRLLRPAESAARRLIVIAARDMEVAPPKRRPEKAPSAPERLQAKGLLVIHEGLNLGLARAWRPEPAAPEKPAPRLPSFPLADSPRRFDAKGWEGQRPFPKDGFTLADPDEEIDARHLCRRIRALKRALDDLDGHAKRLARWKARRDAGLLHAPHHSPMRPGWPPGFSRRRVHAVDDILSDLQNLARAAWNTS